MTEPVIAVGDKLHIITRRIFKEDLRRHFAGEVIAVSHAQMVVRGYAFIFNNATLEYSRRPEVRFRVFPIADGMLITFLLPQTVNLEKLHYHTYDGRLVMTDGSGFSLDINEFSHAS